MAGVRSEQNQASAAAAAIAAASEDINLNPTLLLLILKERPPQAAGGRYFRTHTLGRSHQELNHHSPVVVDDRDSFSSIAAVINSESQVDTAVEIDSMVTLRHLHRGEGMRMGRGSSILIEAVYSQSIEMCFF
ncbi:hypothetical protein Bca52824_007557 [Brassica carinata]|uniref:Uncharacterized protein n=1 Tax=Brassica carinata TaxID=52824 RepID=A0A8X7W848_BRACI|nr:hypothetical protein Bca52824_007557 [Brassica carinata]